MTTIRGEHEDGRLLRLAALVAVVHFGWAAWVALSHPGLSWEPDRVANRLYLAGLFSGRPALSGQWYFPAPKVLAVAIAALGPVGEGIASALASAVLAGCGCWLVGRAAGAAAGVLFAVALGLDPWWPVLVATASGDLLVAAGVAATAAAWECGAIVSAGLAVFLATLVKTPAALVVLPFVPDRRRTPAARAALLASAAAGLLLTLGGFAALLGDPSTPMRFLRAYAQLRGGDVPAVGSWLAKWLTVDLLRDTLGWGALLLPAGLAVLAAGVGAAGLRRWLAGSVAVAAGFVALAVATRTLLFPRFLWTFEVTLLGLAAAGAGWVGARSGGWLATRFGAERGGLLGTAAAGAVLLAAVGLRPGGDAARFEVLYEHGARTAVPWLSALATRLPPGSRLVVPLWFQPAAMVIAPQARVEAAEVLSATGVSAAPQEEQWLLVAPAFGEPAGTAWLAEAATGGTVVESSDLPHMALVRSGGSPAR